MVDLSIAMLNYQRVVATVPDLSISVSRFGRSPEQWVFRGFQTCQFCPRVNGSKMPLWMDPFQFKTLIISNDGGSGRCAACFRLSHLQLPLQKVYPRHGHVMPCLPHKTCIRTRAKSSLSGDRKLWDQLNPRHSRRCWHCGRGYCWPPG